VELLTFGHGTLDQAALVALVRRARLARVVDVRSVPKSRTHPWSSGEAMQRWIPDEGGAQYLWERDLGGFRTALPTSHHTGLRHPAFRGYADYMETERFSSALERLVGALLNGRTAIMCSETLWWKCHRRLISDAAALLHGVDVRHIMAKGQLQPHVLTAGVRREGHSLRYDGTAA